MTRSGVTGEAKPVLQLLEPARATTEMLRGLQRVAEQRLPDAGGGSRGAAVLLCEIGDSDRDELGQFLVAGECVSRVFALKVQI